MPASGRLPAAHNAVYRLDDGSLRQWRYWDLDIEAFRARWGGEDPVETLRELLGSAVAIHMRSDVPVGTCLSGGIDSSALVCLMARAARGPAPHLFGPLSRSRLQRGKMGDGGACAYRLHVVRQFVPSRPAILSTILPGSPGTRTNRRRDRVFTPSTT